MIVLSLVHMHNIHPGANIHPGCKFALWVYFFFVINYFISETTSYNIYRHNTFYYTQVLSSHTVK